MFDGFRDRIHFTLGTALQGARSPFFFVATGHTGNQKQIDNTPYVTHHGNSKQKTRPHATVVKPMQAHYGQKERPGGRTEDKPDQPQGIGSVETFLHLGFGR